MKKSICIFLAVALLLAASVGCARSAQSEAASAPSSAPTAEASPNVNPGSFNDSALYFEGHEPEPEPRNIYELADRSGCVVKARVTLVNEEFSTLGVCQYKFETIEDYFSNVVYEGTKEGEFYIYDWFNRFKTGEVYYLFMTQGMDTLHPHAVNIVSTAEGFKMRVLEDGTLDCGRAVLPETPTTEADMDKALREYAEQVKKDAYDPERDFPPYASAEEFAEVSEDIWVMELTSINEELLTGGTSCDFYVPEVIKGNDADIVGDYYRDIFPSDCPFELGEKYLFIHSHHRIDSRDYFLIPEGTAEYDDIYAKYAG